MDVSLAFTHVYSRLFRNPKLKKGMKALKVSAEALLFAPDAPPHVNLQQLEVPVVVNLHRAEEYIRNLETDVLSARDFDEALSTIEGAKGLLRPRERNVTDDRSRAAAVSRLEEETNRFDIGQLEGYVTALDGPQRISGLAGSGKNCSACDEGSFDASAPSEGKHRIHVSHKELVSACAKGCWGFANDIWPLEWKQIL